MHPPVDPFTECEADDAPAPAPALAPETGGPKGLEPTRYGDWEKNGRCIDF
ncbi:MAG: DUF1674 domain-containing protein [Gammaproteobacteria bacterium]